ncbi:MAG TPA: protein kinase, partial [Micromonosporaceae bacterium]|nr:protein kinase [Micromonosporaceae bacterium]
MSAGLVLGGRYRLISQLGEGGFGSVWRGYDTRLERHVAVKILHAGVDVPRFKREAHALARLSHPNIVAAYDFGIDGSTAYLVLEMITGRTVADELAATRAAGQVGLPVDRVLHLADQVLAGLGAAHAAGLIHRDLKPANIMAVTGGPEIKIVDFGIARTGDASRMTAVGSVLGTLPYMAPEQFDDAQLDGRVDLYSLGCVLHELLTGVSPYQAKNTAAWIKAHHLQAPGHVRDRRPEVPPGVDQFVQHLLVKDPAGRPADAATARAIAATLPRTSGVAQPVPAMPTPTPPTPAVPPPVVPPPGGPVAAGVGAAAAAVGPMGPGSSAVQSGAQGRRMAIVCRKCGHLNPEGTQFCARPGCGEYLDWGTQVRTGMVSGTAAVPKGLYTQKSAASIRLSSSDLSVAPGASTTTTATVHNGGTQIEEFTVSVGGTAAAWATVEPATLRIFPGEQADCVIRVAPPRHSSVPAGKSTFTASALSSVHRSLVASANGTLDVGAYRDLRATLVPAQTRGRGRTMHTIELVNDGNVGEAVRLAATDRTATVRFALPPGEIRLLPGAMAVNMPVKPKWRLIGRPQQYQFQVTVTPTDRPTAPGLATP